MEILLDAAFVIAAVSFFKAQFSWKGQTALGAAFVVSLLVAYAPALASLSPAAAPFVDGLITVIKLFIGAAGSFDTAKALIAFSKQ